MKKKQLILTVGLPRSGKSTWAREQGLPIVNPDSIRLAIHGKPFIPEAEEIVWAIAHIMTKALLLAGHERIIIDATNLLQTHRRRWAGKFMDCEIVFERFDTPKDVCIKRAIDGGREDLVPVIERMDTFRQDV